MHRMTLNSLISLIIQAKITGKGKTGNGRIFIRLLSVIADCPADSAKERWLLAAFSSHTDKQAAYQQINRFLFDFIRNGNGFRPEKITMQTFENKISLYGKTDWNQYRFYLAETGKFCSEILDKEKIPAFVHTMLELLKEDDAVQNIFYGGQFLPKASLISDSPKKICLEALLLGVLYHTLKKFTPADAGELKLMYPEKIKFRLIQLGTTENPVFWGECDELKQLLRPELTVSVKENLEMKNIPETDFCYPLEIQYQNKIILWDLKFSDKINQKYLFLHSSGGMGKSFVLQHEDGLYLSLAGYRNEFRTEICSECSCWILMQILLKYHYHHAYPTYDLCTACEERTPVFRQISDMIQLFRKNNSGSEYTILLDGINEIRSEFQDDFFQELSHICENWHNVRIILSGRTIPDEEIFNQFEKLEILGIPDSVRNDALSEYPETLKDSHLLDILKTPLFLHYFLKNQNSGACLHTQGEILDAYFTNEIRNYDKPLQFAVKYALPILAKRLGDFIMFRRSDVSDTVAEAFQIYVHQEHVWQNLTAPEGFRKQELLDAEQMTDFAELLIERTGILTVSEYQLRFSHEYISAYFGAKYILNAAHALQADSDISLFERLALTGTWWLTDDTPYILLGEICGDYRNIPDKNNILDYHETELDFLLDTARHFHADTIANNIIRTMKFSRNHLICQTDFSGLILPFLIMHNLNFSNYGDYPCNFQGCRILYFPDSSTPITCAVWSSDGKKLLLGMEDCHIILFDVRTGRVLKNYNLHAYLKYGETFQNIAFLNTDKHFTVATEYTKFLMETESGRILNIRSERNTLSYSVRTVAVSPDYQRFLIDDVIYSVTGERQKIQFPERYNHFRNCDFRDAAFLFNPDKNKEILRKSGAVTE